MVEDRAAATQADFSVSHLRDAVFESQGLRAFFEYRDLGIEVQLVYILKGWVRFDYEGVGGVLLEAGACVHQPAGIRHVEIAHSDDIEILEITLPAEFETEAVAAPEVAAAGE